MRGRGSHSHSLNKWWNILPYKVVKILLNFQCGTKLSSHLFHFMCSPHMGCNLPHMGCHMGFEIYEEKLKEYMGQPIYF